MSQPRERPVRLRLTAGQAEGIRNRIAQELRREAARRHLVIDLRPTAGSQEALHALEAGQVDVALVQGGLEMQGSPVLRQVAGLHVDPLHLLVKQEIHREIDGGLAGLRGKREGPAPGAVAVVGCLDRREVCDRHPARRREDLAWI